jgi:hypothetical protein
MSDYTGGRNIAEYDWVQAVITDCTGRCEACTCTPINGIVEGCECDTYCDCIDEELHAPADAAEFDDWDGDPVEGKTACGIGERLVIPGIGSRMGCQRCEKCCEDTGLPSGVGSPKNDQACRDVLGMPPTADELSGRCEL